ncbi:MAG TPA: DEAD/DEAH box helicase family protein [Phycisphaerales bacterium]|nr:DEAD/DEAH box helicase family protein [Phycisphaerales bacterium]
MPPLESGRLCDEQVTAIESLERALASGHPRSFIHMVMGSGKTFTAFNIA